MANPAVTKITVAEGGNAYMRAGDILRVSATGEAIRVTGTRGGQPRYWQPVPLYRAIWRWLRRGGWQRTEVTERYRLIVRVVRLRPSPLPHRLP